jgi:uncharacterized protein (PEP-CTERM system associated)
VVNELSSAEIRAAFQVDNHWQINGYVGEEWNEFVSGPRDIDGTYWDLGVLWTPNGRVSIGAGIGDRFFGSAPRFDINYRHKRSTFVAGYSRTLTYQRNLRTSDDFFDGVDDLAGNVSEQVDNITGIPTTNTPSPLLNEMFRARYSFKGRRTSVSVDGYYSEQTRAQDGFTDIFERVGVTAQRSLWRNLDGVVGITWFGREPDPGRVGIEQLRSSETWRFNLGVTRLLAVNTSVKLDYWHTQRDSDFSLDEYTENRIEVSFKYTF